jgi:hypothetical protein
MILYHGSTVKVVKPLLTKCRAFTDFGKGFYTTISEEQAKKWAKLKQQRDGSAEAIVSVYEIDNRYLEPSDEYNILKFTQADKEWLDFVYANRKGLNSKFYDIVFGPVANDRLYATMALYEQGILTADAAVEQLKTYLLFNQISFHSEQTIRLLSYNSSKLI